MDDTLTSHYPLEAHLFWHTFVQSRAEAQLIFRTFWNHHTHSPNVGEGRCSANFAWTAFSEVRMQERAHNAPEWRYMAVCGDGTARPGVEETTRGSFFEALRTDLQWARPLRWGAWGEEEQTHAIR